MKKKTPLVIVIATRIQATMEMLMGVTEFAQRHGPWNIHPLEVGNWRSPDWKWEDWHADGLILASEIPPDAAERIRNSGIPCALLQITKTMSAPGFPLANTARCLFDSEECGRMAARHFIKQGHRNFAIVESPDPTIFWSVSREMGFRDELRKRLPSAQYFRYESPGKAGQENWLIERPRLISWLQQLPKPCALFAANDRRAVQVSESCRFGGISVPDKLSILGVDDDHWLCNASTPTLSSIQFDTRRAGYEIARILAHLMNGTKPDAKVSIVRPIRVVTRQSTDWFAVSDKKVALTLQHIHNDFANPNFSIPRLARMAGLARRTLEQRFKTATGKTLHEELDEVRLQHLAALRSSGIHSRLELQKGSGYHSLSAMDHAIKRSGLWL